jgi:hypothetical protein
LLTEQIFIYRLTECRDRTCGSEKEMLLAQSKWNFSEMKPISPELTIDYRCEDGKKTG